jgi:hypothetical protein
MVFQILLRGLEKIENWVDWYECTFRIMYLRNNSQEINSVQNNVDGFLFGFFTVGCMWLFVLALILCETTRNGRGFLDGIDAYMDKLVNCFNGQDDVEQVYPSMKGKGWILKRRVLV